MMIDFVFITKLEHLFTLNISIKYLNKHYNNCNILIITKKKNIKYFKRLKYTNLTIIDEKLILPDMSLADLKKMKLPFFPKRAGWYYQQFLKLSISKLKSLSENYAIIDADTIFFKKIILYDNEKFNFLKATEYNVDYFINYKNLLNEEPNRTFSFISQYMIFNKSIILEMLKKIESNFDNKFSWNWLIVNNLIGNNASLFSEYETYGHYIKNHYPNNCSFIELKWSRYGSNIIKSIYPTTKDLEYFEKNYDIVSFEHQEERFFYKIRNYFLIKSYPFIFLLKNYFNG